MSVFANECMYSWAMSMSLKPCKVISAAPMFSSSFFTAVTLFFLCRENPRDFMKKVAG